MLFPDAAGGTTYKAVKITVSFSLLYVIMTAVTPLNSFPGVR